MRRSGAVELSPELRAVSLSGWPYDQPDVRRARLCLRCRDLAPGDRVITDGWSGYCGLPDHDHQPKVVGATLAHLAYVEPVHSFNN